MIEMANDQIPETGFVQQVKQSHCVQTAGYPDQPFIPSGS